MVSPLQSLSSLTTPSALSSDISEIKTPSSLESDSSISVSDQNSSLLNLPCTEEDMADIDFIIKSLGEVGQADGLWASAQAYAKLTANSIAMYNAGERLQKLNTLKFLEIIFSSPDLHPLMRGILNTSSIRGQFLEDLNRGIKKARKDSRFEEHIAAFSKSLNREETQIRRLILNPEGSPESPSWLALLNHLIDTASEHG